MAKFRMIQSTEVKDYFIPLPEYGKTVSVNKNTWYSDVSKLGMALLKYYSESVVFQGATKTVMETLGENESTLENILAGGGTGGVDLTPDGLTSTQAKDAIYKSHSISSSASEIDNAVANHITQAELDAAVLGSGNITAAQAATLDKLDGLGSSASEIDAKVKEYNIAIDKDIGKIEGGYFPTYSYEHPNHSTESVGNSSFTAKILGQYELIENGISVSKIETGIYSRAFKGTALVVKFNRLTFPLTTWEVIEEISIPFGDYTEMISVELSESVFIEANKYLAIIITPDSGYSISMRMWDAPFSGQENPNNRHRFLYANDDNIWGSNITTSYAYLATPLRFTSNLVTYEGLAAVKASLEKSISASVLDVRLIVPSVLHSVVGVEFNLYYDAITLLPDVGVGESNYRYSFTCNVGGQDRRSFRVTPTVSDIGSHTLTISIYDIGNNIITSKVVALVVSSASNLAITKNIVSIGDSTTDDTAEVIKELQTVLASFSGNAPAFKGTHGVSPYNHEARTGQSLAYYSTGVSRLKFTVSGFPVSIPFSPNWVGKGIDSSGQVMLTDERSLDEDGNGYIVGQVWVQPTGQNIIAGWAGQLIVDGNVFNITQVQDMANYSIFKDSNGIGTLDFSYYSTKFGIGTVDLLTIDLGINDSRIYTIQSEATQQGKIDKYKLIIDTYLNFNPSGKVMICIPKSGSSTQCNYEYRANIHRMRELIVENFDNFQYSEKVYICGSGLMMDRYYGYPLTLSVKVASRYDETITKQTEEVHPRTQGYYQVADAMAASVVYILSI